MTSNLRREAGSFRDPSGYILRSEQRIYRSLSPGAYETIRSFLTSPAVEQLLETGSIIHTETVDEPTQAELREHEGLDDRFYVLHKSLWFISYPYEWTGGMLWDAARCTLRVQAALMHHGFNLKDASAYNVQFDFGAGGPQPVFIDVGSIEPIPDTGGVWIPYKQFLSHFLLPLTYYRNVGLEIKATFIADLDGLDPELAYRLTGPVKRLLPPYLTLVTLPHWLRRLETGRNPPQQRTNDQPSEIQREKNLFLLGHTIRSLQKKIERLRIAPGKSDWVGYEDTNSYSREAKGEKEAFVSRVCADIRPETVLDIGCNTGKFSLIAAAQGSKVIAVDTDAASLDRLYYKAQELGASVLPLLIDLTNPSPGIGWKNQERAPFLERAGEFDCVFALAVVHHLLISKGIPLQEIVSLLHKLTRRNLVVELIGPSDPMFQSLLRGRDDLFSGFSTQVQEQAFSSCFAIRQQQQLSGSDRSLYLLEKQDA